MQLLQSSDFQVDSLACELVQVVLNVEQKKKTFNLFADRLAICYPATYSSLQSCNIYTYK